MDQLDQLVISRRTINNFQNELPPQQLILDAIELSRWVPNHHLTQPWHFYFPSKEMVQQIIQLNSVLVAEKKGGKAAESKHKRWSQIPGWLIVTCNISADELQAQEDYAACCCNIYALSLILWQQGIGTKWTTGNVIRHDDFYDICWLDKHSQKVVGLIWYGYPNEIPQPQPRRNVDEIVTIF